MLVVTDAINNNDDNNNLLCTKYYQYRLINVEDRANQTSVIFEHD